MHEGGPASNASPFDMARWPRGRQRAVPRAAMDPSYVRHTWACVWYPAGCPWASSRAVKKAGSFGGNHVEVGGYRPGGCANDGSGDGESAVSGKSRRTLGQQTQSGTMPMDSEKNIPPHTPKKHANKKDWDLNLRSSPRLSGLPVRSAWLRMTAYGLEWGLKP